MKYNQDPTHEPELQATPDRIQFADGFTALNYTKPGDVVDWRLQGPEVAIALVRTAEDDRFSFAIGEGLVVPLADFGVDKETGRYTTGARPAHAPVGDIDKDFYGALPPIVIGEPWHGIAGPIKSVLVNGEQLSTLNPSFKQVTYENPFIVAHACIQEAAQAS